MSNDLTPDKLEEMIFEELKILQENINVKIVSGKDKKGKDIYVNANTVKKDLGAPNATISDIRDVANFDDDGTTLTDDDFEIGFSTKPEHTRNDKYESGYYNIANRVYRKSSDDTKKQIKKIYDKARGGGAATTSSTSATNTTTSGNKLDPDQIKQINKFITSMSSAVNQTANRQKMHAIVVNLLKNADWTNQKKLETAAQAAVTKYGTLNPIGGSTNSAANAQAAANKVITALRGSTKPNDWKKVIDPIISKGDDESFSVAQILIDEMIKEVYGGAAATSTRRYDAVLQRALDKAKGLLDSAADGNTQAANQAQQVLGQVVAYLNKDITMQARKDTQAQVFGDIESSFRGADISSDLGSQYISVKAIKGQSNIDSSLVAQFRALGNSPYDRLRALQDTAEAIASRSFPNDPNEVLAFTTRLNLLNYLGNMGKLQGGPEAGYHFERFIVGLTEGIQVGGSNGAIDVVSANNGVLGATSQKFVQDGKITQAIGTSKSKDAVRNVLNNPNFPGGIFYYVANKNVKGEGLYTSIDIYIVQIKKAGKNNYKAVWWTMDNNGNLKASKSETAVEKSDGKHNWASEPASYTSGSDLSARRAKIEVHAAQGGSPAFTIPIIDQQGSDVTSTDVANYLKDQMSSGTGVFKTIKDNISNVYARLDNMEKNTMEYAAVKGGAQGIADPEDFIKQIATDYTAVKTEWNNVFQTAGSTARVTESIRSLDQLIAETLRDIKRKRKK